MPTLKARSHLGPVLAIAALALFTATARASESPALVPLPVKMTTKTGVFKLGRATRIAAPAALHDLADRFAVELRAATGLPLPVGAAGALTLKVDKTIKNPEGYKLVVTPGSVVVRGGDAAGVFYGLQTLRQLLPVAAYRKAPGGDVVWEVPAVEIEDEPRFAWRGSHLDVGRHFQPKESILKHLDVMALHKLNVFHWHLTEDQGWRIEIKKYPRLTEVGAWRKDSALGPPPEKDSDGKRSGWKFVGRPHGGFYTQDDVREVVHYAAQRFITVVPEIEMPGHARAAVAAYPDLGNTGQPVEVATTWGIFKEVYAPTDHTLAFIKDVLSEVLELFPSKFIHVGGDECPKDQWKASPVAQARIKELGLKNEDELQSWFVKQIDTWLTAKGRRLIGWDEILEGGLAPGAAVMSWRGEQGGVAAAKAGHDVVMAPTDPTYFDYYQAKGPGEPIGIGGFNPIEKVYAYDPMPKELAGEEAKHVLGSQAQIWTEYLPTGRQVEYFAWPRLTAMAEVLWSPQARRNFDDFKARLGTHLQRLKMLDVNYRPLEGPFPASVLTTAPAPSN